MKSRPTTPSGESSIKKIRRLSSGNARSRSGHSADKSVPGKGESEDRTENGPRYSLLENGYAASWGRLKADGQSQAVVAFLGTGELILGYVAPRASGLVLSGPVCIFGPTGSVLLSECEDGKLEGVGLFRLANGDVVVGEWLHGFKNGLAVSFNIDSDKKVFASFHKGEVKVLEKTAHGTITQGGRPLSPRSHQDVPRCRAFA
jgi:hypothetical protein